MDTDHMLTSADPEPPVGTIVHCPVTRGRWFNTGEWPCPWLLIDRDADRETWNKIAGNYGPVTVIEWAEEQ